MDPAAAPLPPPPRPLDAPGAALLRQAFTRAGFDDTNLRALGVIGMSGWKAAGRAALERIHNPSRAALFRFFIFGDALAPADLEPALGGPAALLALEQSGTILRQDNDLYRCPFILVPDARTPALSDPIEDPPSLNPPDDYILPVGGSSRYVDDLTVRDPCSLAVDIGCGQGFLSLRAAAHARRCIATDIHERPLAFTRANAALNGVADRIEPRLGSLFEPLADVRGQIDLLTFNPPFIIQPTPHSSAVATPMEGDSMLEHLIRGIPVMLRERGWAATIGLWEHTDPADPLARPRAWLAGAPCDALILRFKTYSPDEYFQRWVSPHLHESAAPAWKALCEKRGIGAVTYGGIVIHRRTAPSNWLRDLHTPMTLRTGPASDQLRALFKTQTALAAIATPAVLLNKRLRTAPGWRFDPALPLPTSGQRGVAPGLALPLQSAARLEPLVSAFRSTSTARRILTQLSRTGHAPAPEDPAAPALLHSLVSGGALDIVD